MGTGGGGKVKFGILGKIHQQAPQTVNQCSLKMSSHKETAEETSPSAGFFAISHRDRM